MRKILINIKDAVEILEDFKDILATYKEITEDCIKAANGEALWLEFENCGYNIDISYLGKPREGYMTISKNHNKIRYIIRIDFVYINDKVILEVI